MTIAGPISPKLKIASSGTDSDFDVKLIDVYPENYPDPEDTMHGNKRILDAPPLHMGGYQQLLRGEPFRAKFRNSWEKPEPLTPGKEADINFTMPDLVPHLPPRPPHHGPGAKLLVPAHRPQSANIYRHTQRKTGGIPEGHRTGLPPEGRGLRRGSAGDAVTNARLESRASPPASSAQFLADGRLVTQ